MATTSKIAQRVEMLTTNSIQADRPMMAELDAQLAQQTAALAFRCSGNRYNQVYPDTNAPWYAIGDIGIFHGLYFGTSTAGTPSYYPWRLSESSRGVGAIITFAADQRSTFEWRLTTRQMVSAVAITTGEYASAVPSHPMTDLKFIYLDSKDGTAWRIGTVMIRVDNPTLPADGTRTFCVAPQVRLSDTYNTGIDLGATYKVYIKSINIFDFAEDAVGW